MKQKTCLLLAALVAGLCSCERLDDNPDDHIIDRDPEYIELQEVVEIMSLLPISRDQMDEVHNAVSSSSGNGYDEEYTMANLFALPGSGVGDKAVRSGMIYENPMRDLIACAVKNLLEDT